MYKIAHIADTHIRNLKYHDEYRIAFKNLYETLAKDNPDCIVHCGDIAHTKTQLSPEYFQLCAEFLASLANIAPTYIILGNHDGNLKNDTRQDAITPIVNALKHPRLHLLKDSGEVAIDDGLVLNVLSIFDRDNWIKPSDEGKINIALYHGAIAGSMTGANWAMDKGDDDVSIFRDFDFAMLGDIHKQQQLDPDGRVWYCGSTIQQKFSEGPMKGYLLWEIETKDRFKVVKRFISNPRPFITVRLQDNRLPDTHVPRGCRLRLISKINLPSDKLRKIRSAAELKWKPFSITMLNGKESDSSYSEEKYSNSVLSENLRDISIQERYIRDYLANVELEDSVIEKILEHNKTYNVLAQQNEEVSRNVVWKIKNAQWDNLFNYGEKNEINFENLNGLVGIFGRNYSGKSSIIDSILFTLFNATSKGERKNVHVINQNRGRAKGKVQIEIGNNTYQICRNLEKYTKKSRGKETQEARVDLDFSLISEDESLNGTTRNETDANIRKRFGTMEDFLLTSMASQLDSLSFVKEGSTKRKEILAKFLDLEIFDKKFKLAKKDAAEMRGIIKKLKDKKWDCEIQKNKEILEEIEIEMKYQKDKCLRMKSQRDKLVDELLALNTQIDSIPAEIINIDEVENTIGTKTRSRSKLLRRNIDIASQIEDSGHKLKESQETVSKIDHALLLLMKDRAEGINSRVEDIKLTISSLARDRKNNEKKAKLLNGIPCGDQYPRCKFICDANKAKGSLPGIEDEILNMKRIEASLMEDLKDINLDNIQEQLSVVDNLKQQINICLRSLETNKLTLSSNKSKAKLLLNEIEDLQSKRQEYEDNREAIENLETLSREKTGLEKSIQAKTHTFDKCQKKITDLLVEQGSTKVVIKTLESNKKELEEIERDWIAYDLFMQCMHPNGIPYNIIKQKLPLLNEEIAKILGNIVDFEVFFENSDSKLNILIKHPFYDPRPLSMGSGAEKTLASMAIRLALISITNLPKSELFILDEPATALDQEHMEGFTNLLRLIKNQFKTVILISHLDSLKDVVDMAIDINKVDGYANVRV